MKNHVQELAVLGGTPLFEHALHVGRPNVPDPAAVLENIRSALERSWLTNDGPLVQELERRLAEYLNVAHCVAVCNATVGMEVLARALNLTGEVVLPAFTFIATPHAFSWLGIDPVFCDIDAESHTIDVRAAEKRITDRTSAIIGVHLWGRACNVAALEAMAAQYGLPVIYDAAHAFGSSFGQTRVGNFGTAEVFSFHATKFFNTFEGGAITTRDRALAERLRLMRNFGFAGYDEVATVGTNAKLSEAHAAMGITLFDHLDDLLQRNVESWAAYAEGLRGLKGVRLLQPADGYGSNYQYVVIELHEGSGLTRDQLLNVLWRENIRARRYFFPGCHRSPPYLAGGSAQLPVTERIADQVLVLPAGAGTAPAEIATVVQLIRFALANAGALAGVLPKQLPPGAFKA